MHAELFVVGLALLLALLLRWSFKVLPREHWQIIAAMPRRKHGDGRWDGLNLTYYGFFNANAYTLATLTVFLMLGAVGVHPGLTLVLTCCLLAICAPASRLIARIVEKKRYTFSIGGASFLGIMIAPWVILAVGQTTAAIGGGSPPAVGTVMAALTVAYAMGEGVGRLACISYGCCYGKPMASMPAPLRRLFERHCFVFSGCTKKIAYADGWDGEPVFPIQGVTAALYCTAGLAGIYLFLKGYFLTAFIETLLTTQIWRFVSEFLRADYRGGGKISAYQKMGVVASIYGIAICFVFPVPADVAADIVSGVRSIWDPALLLFFQSLWIASFLYTGRSEVTGSKMSFHVIKENT